MCRARIEGELAKCGGADQKFFEETKAKRQKRQEALSKDDRTDKTVRFAEVPEGEPPRKKTVVSGEKDDRIRAPDGVDISVDDDGMALAEWHTRSREAEQEGRSTRQRGGASSSSGPAPQGQKRKDEAGEQLNPLRLDLAQTVYEDIGRVVIECRKRGSFDNGVDVAELFNPERFTSKAASFGLQPGTSFDLRCG